MKKRFTEEQIIQILKEQEAGERTADVCRRQGISQPTFYKWKAKFGGMEVSDARKLKTFCQSIFIYFSIHQRSYFPANSGDTISFPRA